MTRYGLYVFDLDGTLIDSSRDLAFSVNSVLEQLGLRKLPEEVVLGHVGHGVHNLLGRSLEGGGGSRDMIEAARELFKPLYSEHLLDTTHPYPGAVEALYRLAPSRRAICTNKPGEFSERILSGLGLSHLFELVISGDSLAHRKPHPAPLMEILDRTGIGPEDTLMVGDMLVDLETAQAAGTSFCGVSYGLGDPEQLRSAGAERTISDLRELAL